MTSQQFSTPCTCRGGNPSCFRCGGWGYLDGIGKGRASPGPTSVRTSHIMLGRSRGKLEICPICKIGVKRLKKHLLRAHEGKSAPPNGAKFESVERQPTQNKECAKKISTRLKPPTKPRSMPTDSPRRIQEGFSLEACPLCDARVRASNLKRHVRTKHAAKFNMLDAQDQLRLDKWLREYCGISLDLKGHRQF